MQLVMSDEWQKEYAEWVVNNYNVQMMNTDHTEIHVCSFAQNNEISNFFVRPSAEHSYTQIIAKYHQQGAENILGKT